MAKEALILFSKESVELGEADAEKLAQVLRDAAGAQGLDLAVAWAFYDDLLHILSADGASIVDVVSGRDIADFDVVYQRRWGAVPEQALACAIYLKGKGVRSFDQETNRAGSKNKLTQYWRFWEAGLPFPVTAFGGFGPARDALLANLDVLPFGFPLILKGVDATRGQDNYLIQTHEELRQKLAERTDTDFLLQEFLPNDGDYRIIVAGGQPRFAMYRTAAAGTHTNNTSQGGEAALVDMRDISKNILDDAVTAAAAFGRDFAGVDVVLHKDTGAHYFFEVNRSPQIESGKFVEEKAKVLAQYLYDEASV
ncbi:MAG TPA: hypothetical protein VJR27_05685 [Candidatus Saccharimonadales bacterium]|nr:hypothetical protein [Candidatus Saccharimonadales bacterium]